MKAAPRWTCPAIEGAVAGSRWMRGCECFTCIGGCMEETVEMNKSQDCRVCRFINCRHILLQADQPLSKHRAVSRFSRLGRHCFLDTRGGRVDPTVDSKLTRHICETWETWQRWHFKKSQLGMRVLPSRVMILFLCIWDVIAGKVQKTQINLSIRKYKETLFDLIY